MAFNQYMHPLNCYKDNPPNFEKLAKDFPEFKKHLQKSKSGKSFVNFRNPKAVYTLSKCLLKRDFDLDVEFAPGTLVPTIPSRLNYILWMQDLLQCFPKQESYHLFDIGCGSSCVYPLLGCRLNSTWKFTASELDPINFEFAKQNVKTNSLSDRISLEKVESSQQIFPPKYAEIKIDACMCNPPFYTSSTDVEASTSRPTANSSCTGNSTEMVFKEGGDLAFSMRIFNESVSLQKQVKWFTTMLGKKASFMKFQRNLDNAKVPTVSTTEFCQGNTMRWAVAWTFNPEVNVPNLPVSQFKNTKVKNKRPITILSKFGLPSETKSAVCTCLSGRNIQFTIEEIKNKFVVKFSTDKSAWINNRRKRRAALQRNDTKRLCDAIPTNFTTTLVQKDEISFQSFSCIIEIILVDGKNTVEFTSNPVMHEELNMIAIFLKGKV